MQGSQGRSLGAATEAGPLEDADLLSWLKRLRMLVVQALRLDVSAIPILHWRPGGDSWGAAGLQSV